MNYDQWVGKTVTEVRERAMAGRDTYDDWHTWTETVIVFDGGEEVTLGGDDTEVYDAFEYDGLGLNDEPLRKVPDDAPASTCRHCQRHIVHTEHDGWIDPEATGDDSIWRETCADNHEDRIAAHEPFAPSVGKYEGLWVMENQAGKRWAVGPKLGDKAAHPGQSEIHTGRWVAADSGEFTSWTDTELEAKGLDSDHLDEVATEYSMPAGLWININEA